MKTFSSAGLLILFTTSMLVACDSKSGQSKEPAAATSAAVEKAEPEQKPAPAAEAKKPEKDDKDKGGW